MQLELVSQSTFAVGSIADIGLRYRPSTAVKPGGRLWLFWDIRQGAGWLQRDDPGTGSFLSVHGPHGREIAAQVHSVRTLDLYPRVPEFTGVVECDLGDQPLSPEETIEIRVENWQAPLQPIDPFRLWVLADNEGALDVVPTGYKTYRAFVERGGGKRVLHEQLVSQLSDVTLTVTGQHEPVAEIHRRRTPDVFWGDLHGMAFNQRPLDDFYEYAQKVTALDFCAALLFSYNTCVESVWEEVKEAARRHTAPGRFIAFAGFECGTPADGSHRCVYFPQPGDVPPIFCDSRPPAQDHVLQARFHPDTVLCETLDDLYGTVDSYGGFVAGHFHTTTYDRELLAEMWQKQVFPVDEEQRVLEYLRQGKRFGLVAGSDTHDSMPGNPYPEPGCPRQAGATGVYAEALTPEALVEAFRVRRVFATTGARMVVEFEANGHPMGSELPRDGAREFHIVVYGTTRLGSVELLRDGVPVSWWYPRESLFDVEVTDKSTLPSQGAFYLVRVEQIDGHMAWSSPIWFG